MDDKNDLDGKIGTRVGKDNKEEAMENNRNVIEIN